MWPGCKSALSCYIVRLLNTIKNDGTVAAVDGLQKKSAFFVIEHWIFRHVCVIVCALFAQMCPTAAGADSGNPPESDVQKADRKTVEALEKELAAVKSEAEKKLADLQAELNLVKQGNAVIRRELLETLDKFSMLADRLKRYEMSAAAVVESLNPVYAGAREEESAESLRTVMQSSAALASASASLCDEVLELLGKSSLDPVLSAKLRLRINSLKNEIRNTAFLTVPPIPPEGFTSCRILNLDEKLNAVVLSAGYRNGVRSGMLLRSRDGKIVLRVVALRNFMCAALVSVGDIRSIGIGMEVFATSNTVR